MCICIAHSVLNPVGDAVGVRARGHKGQYELLIELIPLTWGTVEFRVHIHLKTDLHWMHEIDSLDPWPIIQLQLMDRNLTPVFHTEFVRDEKSTLMKSRLYYWTAGSAMVQHAPDTALLWHQSVLTPYLHWLDFIVMLVCFKLKGQTTLWICISLNLHCFALHFVCYNVVCQLFT